MKAEEKTGLPHAPTLSPQAGEKLNGKSEKTPTPPAPVSYTAKKLKNVHWKR